MDSLGGCYPISLENSTLNLFPNTFILESNQNKFMQNFVKIKSIEILEDKNLYEKETKKLHSGRYINLNNKVIKIEKDSQKANIIFHDKLDAMGLSKFTNE